MGFRISWLATQAPVPEVVAALGARKSGQSGDFMDFDLSIGRLSNGWTIIWSEDEEFFDDPCAISLSLSFPLLTCWVNETIMHSRVRSVANGIEKWSIWHEGDEDPTHIGSAGNPPAELSELIADAREQQSADNEVDYLFDVPLIVAEGICGFKHDQIINEESSFEELLAQRKSKSGDTRSVQKVGWLSRIFGRSNRA
jgi:hypothetical protein